MALDFPASPTDGQEYTIGSRVYQWNDTLGVWGNATKAVSGAYTRTPYTFNIGDDTVTQVYSPTRIEVMRQGILLPENEYTADNGTTIVLDVAASVDGEVIEVIEWKVVGVANTYTKDEIDAMSDSGLENPIITYTSPINGGRIHTYTITNYGSDLTYIVTGSDGTGSVTGDTITWTFTDSDPTRNEQLFIKATKEGYIDSPTTTETINVVYVPVVEDQDFVAVIDNYNILANITNNSTDIESVSIDTTNIISTASADSFDTTTQVVDGDTINVDGTDMVADGVTGGSSVDLVDFFNDGSSVTLYNMDGNSDDSSGAYNGVDTAVTYDVGKFGEAGVYNGSTSITQAGNVDRAVTTLSFWFKAASSVGNQTLISTGNGVSTQIGYVVHILDGKLAIQKISTGNGIHAQGTTPILSSIADGDFHHIVAKFTNQTIAYQDISTFELYYDGTKQDLTATTSGTNNGFGNFYGSLFFGANKIDTTLYSQFNGSIDQVRVLNKILTQNEVDKLYSEVSYTVDTTAVTAGSTPTTAYINESRAIYDTITQDVAETDFIGMTSSVGLGENFEATFDYVDINVGSTTDVINTTTKVVDGDKLVVVNDSDVISEIVASGVTDDGTTYSIPHTGMTSSSKVYAVDDKVSFKFGDGDYQEAVVDSSSYLVAPELITNGTFDTDVTGWSTDGSTTASFDSGTMLISRNGGSLEGVKQTVTTDIGIEYNLNFNITSVSTLGNDDVSVTVGSADNLSDVFITQDMLAGTYEFTFVAISTSSFVEFLPTGNVDCSFNIDNISINKKLKLTSTRIYSELLATTPAQTFDTKTQFKAAGNKMKTLTATVLKGI